MLSTEDNKSQILLGFNSKLEFECGSKYIVFNVAKSKSDKM